MYLLQNQDCRYKFNYNSEHPLTIYHWGEIFPEVAFIFYLGEIRAIFFMLKTQAFTVESFQQKLIREILVWTK